MYFVPRHTHQYHKPNPVLDMIIMIIKTVRVSNVEASITVYLLDLLAVCFLIISFSPYIMFYPWYTNDFDTHLYILESNRFLYKCMYLASNVILFAEYNQHCIFQFA